LALGFAASGQPTGEIQDLQCAHLASEAERHKKQAVENALALAEYEISRLNLAAQAVEVSASLADEREKSRQALEEAGVPAMTLESDIVGEAEIAQSLDRAMREMDHCKSDVEALCRALGRVASDNAPGDKPTDAETALRTRAGELLNDLKQCIQRCDEQRKMVTTLLSQVHEFSVGTPPNEREDGYVDGADDYPEDFLLGCVVTPPSIESWISLDAPMPVEDNTINNDSTASGQSTLIDTSTTAATEGTETSSDGVVSKTVASGTQASIVSTNGLKEKVDAPPKDDNSCDFSVPTETGESCSSPSESAPITDPTTVTTSNEAVLEEGSAANETPTADEQMRFKLAERKIKAEETVLES
jgi:hypothetical protein